MKYKTAFIPNDFEVFFLLYSIFEKRKKLLDCLSAKEELHFHTVNHRRMYLSLIESWWLRFFVFSCWLFVCMLFLRFAIIFNRSGTIKHERYRKFNVLLYARSKMQAAPVKKGWNSWLHELQTVVRCVVLSLFDARQTGRIAPNRKIAPYSRFDCWFTLSKALAKSVFISHARMS